MGIYELYWFYRNWQLIKARESLDISPFWRTFFAYFFCYECFSRIREYGNSHGAPGPLAAGPLAGAWIIMHLTWKLPAPYLLIVLISFAFILPVQAHANRINKFVAPQHDPNTRFSAWNWGGIVVGGLFVVLAVIGAFLPKQ